MSYVVQYHPEGWRSAKDEPPEKAGRYIVAIDFDNGFKDIGARYYSAEDKWLTFGTVTHWQPLPTPPWEIFPKENKNE